MALSASAHVVLEIVVGMNGGCGPAKVDFIRTLRDGSIQPGLGWRVPIGQALVVTDVDWHYIHPQGAAAAGKVEVLRLYIENLTTPDRKPVFESSVTLSSHGEGGISEAMTTGFVVSSKARICPDVSPGPMFSNGGLQHLILRGYLIADS